MRTLLVGMVVLVPRLVQADEARDIIDRALKAMGGEEKLSQFKAETWKAKGVFSAGGFEGNYTIAYAFQEPNQFRFDMKMDAGGMKLEITAASDGKTAWEQGMGMLREMTPEKSAEFKHSVYAMHVSSLRGLRDKAFRLSALGEAKAGDKTLQGVKVSREGQRDVTLFFDKQTGLLSKIETRVVDEFTNKEVTQETTVEDYKDIGGLKFFTKMTVKRDGQVMIKEELSDQKPVPKLDATLFTKPQS